jgi:FAD/FMN-containing dehydrogenase
MSCISQPSFVRVSSSAKSTEVAAQPSNTCMELIIEHLHEIERQRDAHRDGFGVSLSWRWWDGLWHLQLTVYSAILAGIQFCP